MMTHQLEALDEYPIARVPDIPWWTESHSLLGCDVATRKAVFYNAGRWHGDTSIWRELLAIALPDGRVIHAKGFGRNATEKGPGGAFSRYEVLEPGHTLQLTYEGPVWQGTNPELFAHGFQDGPTQRATVNLLFEATVPMWNMSGDSAAAATIAGASRIEQIGTVTGDVVHDGQLHRFTEGYSIRTHARGPRNVSTYHSHLWVSGSFPGQDLSFYLYAMTLRDIAGFAMANASLVRDGQFHPATIVQADLPQCVEDLTKLPSVILRSALGEMKIVFAELIAHVVTGVVHPYDSIMGGRARQSSSIIIDGGVRLDWDGNQGIGWLEHGYAPMPL